MQNAQQGMILGGDLYFDFLTDAGVPTGFDLAGNANRLIPKVESETLENPLNGRDTLGQIGDAYSRVTAATISFTMNRYDPNIVAAFFLGSVVAITAAEDDPFTATITAVADKWVYLGRDALKTCVVKDDTDTTTYDSTGDDPDYEVNLRMGLIRVLSTGTIENGDELHISGTGEAVSGSKITGATKPIINVRLMLDGKNYVNGADVKLLVWQAQIRGDGEFDVLNQGGFPALQFSGTMITPAGKTAPFEIW